MTQPVVLPTDFMSEWSNINKKQESEVDLEKGLYQPPLSRITASGFTDTTVRNESQRNIEQARVDLLNALETSQKQSRDYERMRNPYIKPSKRREFNENRKQDLKLAEDLKGLSELVLDKGKEVKPKTPNYEPPQRTKEEAEWEEEAKDRYVKMSDFTEFAKMIQGSVSVHPADSASQANKSTVVGYESMGQRTLIHNSGQSQKLSGILEMESDIEGTVIGGFDMTPEEKMREVDSYVNINPVRGLPRIFLNDRLNFLSHIHSALFKLLTSETGEYPTIDCLEILLDNRKYWGNEPSTLLLETVIDSTVDGKSGVVKSNPFRLPIIEPTMQLTSKIMHMALDQLHREFEIEWFNTMKTLTTPKFQSKYEKNKYRSEKRLRRQSSSSESKYVSSSGSRSSRKSSVDESRSVLGSIFR